ncbi:MAG: hypothetical protein F6J90_00105 [Moorea sp. SIOASIH]|uniref:hypothetical protein n=1 Tax=Moorena sp. SIOASIH TaxID=2607817 RepID=UPI0013BE6073|nr:hypothetical protein [Moorena sp. SIOASIH]NEO34792.1 hypothetical protein [Moorena sp. SIOASIH]
MAWFFPQAHGNINWSQSYESLDTDPNGVIVKMRLFRLIEWMMVLPEELEGDFRIELKPTQEQNRMP